MADEKIDKLIADIKFIKRHHPEMFESEIGLFSHSVFYRNWAHRFRTLGLSGVVAIPNTSFDEWLIWFRDWMSKFTENYEDFKDLVDKTFSDIADEINNINNNITTINNSVAPKDEGDDPTHWTDTGTTNGPKHADFINSRNWRVAKELVGNVMFIDIPTTTDTALSNYSIQSAVTQIETIDAYNDNVSYKRASQNYLVESLTAVNSNVILLKLMNPYSTSKISDGSSNITNINNSINFNNGNITTAGYQGYTVTTAAKIYRSWPSVYKKDKTTTRGVDYHDVSVGYLTNETPRVLHSVTFTGSGNTDYSDRAVQTQKPILFLLWQSNDFDRFEYIASDYTIMRFDSENGEKLIETLPQNVIDSISVLVPEKVFGMSNQIVALVPAHQGDNKTTQERTVTWNRYEQKFEHSNSVAEAYSPKTLYDFQHVENIFPLDKDDNYDYSNEYNYFFNLTPNVETVGKFENAITHNNSHQIAQIDNDDYAPQTSNTLLRSRTWSTNETPNRISVEVITGYDADYPDYFTNDRIDSLIKSLIDMNMRLNTRLKQLTNVLNNADVLGNSDKVDKIIQNLINSGAWNTTTDNFNTGRNIATGNINLFGGSKDGNSFIRTNSGATENDIEAELSADSLKENFSKWDSEVIADDDA